MTTTDNDKIQTYIGSIIGVAANEFKTRYRNHVESQRHKKIGSPGLHVATASSNKSK